MSPQRSLNAYVVDNRGGHVRIGHDGSVPQPGARGYLPTLSNSPFRTPPRKACHSSGVNRRTGPAESLLLRTPTVPPGRLATSTQLPLA
jgi:hypothetical protein